MAGQTGSGLAVHGRLTTWSSTGAVERHPATRSTIATIRSMCSAGQAMSQWIDAKGRSLFPIRGCKIQAPTRAMSLLMQVRLLADRATGRRDEPVVVLVVVLNDTYEDTALHRLATALRDGPVHVTSVSTSAAGANAALHAS